MNQREDDGAGGSVTAAGSVWQPLHLRMFRTLWLAQLVSNVSSWMQTVGAQWLVTEETGSASMVALIQTAASLPILVLGIPAGALADIFDRRRLLLISQFLMFVASGLLAVLTALGHMNSYGVLILTFVLGCGNALMTPSWQAIQPDLVPREQIPNAASLNGVNLNLSRAVGPAIGGLIVALAGSAAAFAVNALSFLVTAAALLVWRDRREPDPLGAERILPALRAGHRYVRHAPRIRRVLGRSLLFVPAGTALWALLPVVADRRLELGAGGYGLLLGAFGAGAVAGAALLPYVRGHWSTNTALTGGGVLFALAMAVLALTRVPWIGGAVLVFAGMSWVSALSTFNAQMQVTTSGWVRARALAVYLTLFAGSMAIGAAVWGALAELLGLVITLLAAAALMAIGTFFSWRYLALPDTNLDRSLSVHWPAPNLMLEPAKDDGPVLVTVEYRVPADRADDFVEAMQEFGLSRLRTGALTWDLYQNGEDPEAYLETFAVASWEEHLRQHSARLTASDRAIEERARSLVDPTKPFQVSHYLPARLGDGERVRP
ncbi:MFS transporter [Nonomuraea terrae]|uniref:MFS transporter n=1 Tax=Nonomuraea terrae TaxID=2530383 RepID=A0A4R4YJ79_9ACTN|nr:MFS transporter [Nonomuraea terrae]TDD44988.1 MFS transporter [Nonomuraea terrae]